MHKHILPLLLLAILTVSFAAPTQKSTKKPIQSHHNEYLYTIGNGTDRTLNFYVSTDSVKWEQMTVEENFQKKLSYNRETIFFKIYTTHSDFLSYNLAGNNVYKIYYNPAIDRFDLLKY